MATEWQPPQTHSRLFYAPQTSSSANSPLEIQKPKSNSDDMPRIATLKMRTLAARLRTALRDGRLDVNFEGDLLELCLLAERAADIEETRVATRLTDAEPSQYLVTFAELEHRINTRDRKLVELEDYARARGGDFAAGVGAVFLMLEDDTDHPSSS